MVGYVYLYKFVRVLDGTTFNEPEASRGASSDKKAKAAACRAKRASKTQEQSISKERVQKRGFFRQMWAKTYSFPNFMDLFGFIMIYQSPLSPCSGPEE